MGGWCWARSSCTRIERLLTIVFYASLCVWVFIHWAIATLTCMFPVIPVFLLTCFVVYMQLCMFLVFLFRFPDSFASSSVSTGYTPGYTYIFPFMKWSPISNDPYPTMTQWLKIYKPRIPWNPTQSGTYWRLWRQLPQLYMSHPIRETFFHIPRWEDHVPDKLNHLFRSFDKTLIISIWMSSLYIELKKKFVGGARGLAKKDGLGFAIVSRSQTHVMGSFRI